MSVVSDCIKVKPIVYYFLYKKEYTEEETDKFISQLSKHIEISNYKIEIFSEQFKLLNIRAACGFHQEAFENSFNGSDLIVITYNPFAEKEVTRVPLNVFKEYLKINPKVRESFYNMYNGIEESSLEFNKDITYTPKSVSKTIENNK